MREKTKKQIGSRIAQIRDKHNKTLEEFGNIIDGATKSNVSKWEKGEVLPNRKRLKMIADFDGLALEELIYGDLTSYVYALAEDFKQNPPDKESQDSLANMSEDQYKMIISILMERVKEKHLSYDRKDKILSELRLLVMQHFFDFSIFGLSDFSFNILNDLERDLAGLKEGKLLHEDEKEEYERWIQLIEKFIAEVKDLQEQK